MKRFIIILVLVCSSLSLQAQENRKINDSIKAKNFTIYYASADTSVVSIQEYVKLGMDKVSVFLKRPFKNPVRVNVFPGRDQLDSHWQSAWDMPSFKSQCWMVGSGIQSCLDLLSPSVWKTEACEHDPDDPEEIRLLVYHELTHILHSDYNRSPAFDTINNIDWFVEGLATYVSGQLDPERIHDAVTDVKRSGGPKYLSEFWKGQNKYGFSGSLVAYIDNRYGRDILCDLMQYNDVDDILNTLKISERELIASWKEALLNTE